MNYTSQLRGWAIDRIIEMRKSGMLMEITSLDEIQEYATKLASYAYVPKEDLDSTAKSLFELVRNAEADKSNIDAIIATLEHIKRDRESQGLETKETVQ